MTIFAILHQHNAIITNILSIWINNFSSFSSCDQLFLRHKFLFYNLPLHDKKNVLKVFSIWTDERMDGWMGGRVDG